MDTNDATNTDEVRRSWPRVYMVNDNGEWMDMTFWRGRTGAPASVHFLVVEAEDDDDLYEKADNCEGESLGRVFVVDGRPILETDQAALWIGPSEPLGTAEPGERGGF